MCTADETKSGPNSWDSLLPGQEPSLPFSLEETRAPLSTKRGAEVIREFWKTLPAAPGVYRMFDGNREVLYVGKAKNLKNRVASYTRDSGHSHRISRMIAETEAMEFITTETETEALLLEANLIKQLRPRYNVLMRDDKSLPYILIATDHEAPQLIKHRGARNRKGRYFGPFANVSAVDRTIAALQRAFLLRTCTDSYYANRSRPCLLFQIKRCSAPCTGEITPEQYAGYVDEACRFLSGKSTAVRRRLSEEMEAASARRDYEAAARLRDRIAALSAVQGTQDINTRSVEEADVFAVSEQAGQFCVEVFFFRNWQNWGNRSYFPKADKSFSPSDVLNAFLGQFYADKPAARSILLSDNVEDTVVLSEALAANAGHKVVLSVPVRGERRRLVDYARRNATEALERKLAETATQTRLLEQLVPLFSLPRTPRRIEVYDNSHISGTNAVGAMIVAGVSGFMKQHYRTFNIKSADITPGDDFGMMKEVLSRRFARLVKESPRTPPGEDMPPGTDGASTVIAGNEAIRSSTVIAGNEAIQNTNVIAGDSEAIQNSNVIASDSEAIQNEESDTDEFPEWPDLILIDGGEGQVEAVRNALREVGVKERDVAIVGVAKGRDRDAGRETLCVPGKKPFRLSPRDPALYFIQRLRDEAHRFAVGTHRARRKKSLAKSPLDDIAGIGPGRKRLLMMHFGTAKAVESASVDDLKRIPGISAQLAQTIFDRLHGR
jgi:excinuclease ABC subunit C